MSMIMTMPLWTAPGYLLVGVALAAAYLGVLWIAVKRLPGTARPTLLVLGGFILRMAGLAALLLLATQAAAGPISLALVGFVGTRMLILHRISERGALWN